MSFGPETNWTRPSRVSSRLVTCRLDLVSSRDFRLVTGPKQDFFPVILGPHKLRFVQNLINVFAWNTSNISSHFFTNFSRFVLEKRVLAIKSGLCSFLLFKLQYYSKPSHFLGVYRFFRS